MEVEQCLPKEFETWRFLVHCFERQPTKIMYRFNNPMLRQAVLQRMLQLHVKELANRQQIWKDAQAPEGTKVWKFLQ